jgi:exo-1,4-beta-D-glucosaminidase
VTWSDNYVSLWPGETVTLRAEYRSSEVGDAAPSVDISGWNIPSQRIPTS